MGRHFQLKRNPKEPAPALRGRGRPPGSLCERDPVAESKDADFVALVMAQGGLPRSEFVIDAETRKERMVYIAPGPTLWKHIPRSIEYMAQLRAELEAKRNNAR